jgi:hypothetical protein
MYSAGVGLRSECHGRSIRSAVAASETTQFPKPGVALLCVWWTLLSALRLWSDHTAASE